MPPSISAFLDGSYAPHGYCLLWQPSLIWTHVISDALIALAYFSIPIALITIVRRRGDIAFGGMFWLFAVFILSCGLTHVMGIWNLWHGDYGAEAVIKAITAAASVPTAILMWSLLPKVLAIPSPSMLQRKNEDLALAVKDRDALLAQLRAEIDGRKRAEAALVQAKEIEAVGQLTGGIAHDFNNLLQAISGNLELIGMSPDRPDKVKRWTGNAAAAVDRGTKLTSQLLTFSRQQRLETRPVAVDEMLEGMRELIRNSVGPQIDLAIDSRDGLCTVRSDPTQLELAILNLAINARDAMPDGGQLKIRTEACTIGENDPALAIIVSDSGVGMAPGVMERALEPFFTTKGPGEGTGLGLSMAYGVAQQAGGTLSIASEPARGTTVTMVLPCCSSMDRDPALAVEGEQAQPAIVAPVASILLVDDDPEVRETLADMISSGGHRVRQVDNGVEALSLIDADHFDLLLLDFAMPGMNGAELASEALKVQPGLKLLFLTGFSDSAAIDRAVDGRATVLKKPIGAEALLTAIEDLLD